MKILCIGRNYLDHARELNNPVPEKPVFFMKASNSLLKSGKPFYYPDFSNDIHYEAEVVLRVGRLGKHIATEFAHSYIDAVTLGIDLTARDLQSECKKKGLPWEIAKAFDHSAVIGEWVQDIDIQYNISFSLQQNNKTVQDGNTRDMIFPFADLIAYLSRFNTLRTGDLIFTGTPSGVGPVTIGDHYEGYIGGRKVLDLNIK